MEKPTETFELTLWNNDPSIARKAEQAKIRRIGLDLEFLGKGHRQSGHDTWISQHQFEELPALRKVLTDSQLFVRCNPYGSHSKDEINRLLDAGVQVFMLPNFSTVKELENVLSILDGQAILVPLLERVAALKELECMLSIQEIREYHIGLNDLSIDLNLPNRLQVLTDPLLEETAIRITSTGKRLGIGGIARLNDDRLPIPADLIFARLAFLQASGALISRSFRIWELSEADLNTEIEIVRARIKFWLKADSSQIFKAKEQLMALTSKFRDTY